MTATPDDLHATSNLPNVAIVEDSRTIRRLLEVLLEERYRTVGYETGAEALAGLAASLPDVVLLDISLPDLDGTEVLRRLRDDPVLRGLPIVALTAHAEPEDRRRYLDMGFDAYVAKPIVDENVLFDEIDRLIAGPRPG